MSPKIEARREGMRRLILDQLSRQGGAGTAPEIAAKLGKKVEHVTPRFTELAAAKEIADSGHRKRTKGRPQVIWIDRSRFAPATAQAVAQAVAQASPAEPTVTDESEAPEWFKRFGL
jgi:predicted ArsR family transcriptional regulator